MDQRIDKQTSKKAKGEYRLLLVDGHNSHYTRAFLEYARAHKILVLCYPAHTTHLLQGLDVAVFATVKHCLSEERDKHERETGEKIGKENFLKIYGAAHAKSLTPDIIQAAFRKTDIVPFNQNVISREDMAPSKETSCKAYLPAEVAPEIQMLANLMQNMTIESSLEEGVIDLS